MQPFFVFLMYDSCEGWCSGNLWFQLINFGYTKDKTNDEFRVFDAIDFGNTTFNHAVYTLFFFFMGTDM